MRTPIETYQALIDTLVARRECVSARRARDNQPWPDTAANAKYNEFVASLSPEQRVLLAEMLQSARDGGIHDVLVMFSEFMNLRGLRFVQDGEELPHEPYGTELHYDWVARREGDPWPNEA